jgi:GTPase
MATNETFIPITPPRTLVIALKSPFNPVRDVASYVQEFYSLIKTVGLSTEHKLEINLRTIDPAYYITRGKLDDIIAYCQEHAIEEVVLSEPLSPQQERNLARILRARVFDRTALILEIFLKGAHTAEGKLQVELARLQHKKSRLAGHGVALSQQSGRIGTKGPGETQKEKDLQHLDHLMVKIRRDLAHLRKVRDTQRKQRVTGPIPLFCLIGYTNAGKSTILNALTKSDVLAEDKLFATLDTTTREWYQDNKKQALISDTVGFIQQLPHHLIQAFTSTLDELHYAHLLIQVVDASDPNWQEHIDIVNKVLHDLGVLNKPMVYVFNKIDRVPNPDMADFTFRACQPHVLTCAQDAHGLDALKEYLKAWIFTHQRS